MPGAACSIWPSVFTGKIPARPCLHSCECVSVRNVCQKGVRATHTHTHTLTEKASINSAYVWSCDQAMTFSLPEKYPGITLSKHAANSLDTPWSILGDTHIRTHTQHTHSHTEWQCHFTDSSMATAAISLRRLFSHDVMNSLQSLHSNALLLRQNNKWSARLFTTRLHAYHTFLGKVGIYCVSWTVIPSLASLFFSRSVS